MADLPVGVLGYWSPRRRRISLADHLSVIERRWVLAHELGHALGGHWWDGDVVIAQAMEEEADDWASRRLVPIRLLASTAHHSVRECARLLYLPTEAMMTRMQHLHPAEIHVLRRAAHHRGE